MLLGRVSGTLLLHSYTVRQGTFKTSINWYKAPISFLSISISKFDIFIIFFLYQKQCRKGKCYSYITASPEPYRIHKTKKKKRLCNWITFKTDNGDEMKERIVKDQYTVVITHAFHIYVNAFRFPHYAYWYDLYRHGFLHDINSTSTPRIWMTLYANFVYLMNLFEIELVNCIQTECALYNVIIM